MTESTQSVDAQPAGTGEPPADVRAMISRCWPGWRIGRLLGRGEYGCVYRAEKSIAGRETLQAAIKVVEVPWAGASDKDLALLGIDVGAAPEYFEGVANRIVEEIGVMNSLRGASNVVLIEDAAAERREDGRGWMVAIRMELLEGLPERQEKLGGFPVAEAVRVARDVACALVACGRQGIVHRDVKPSNVFWSEQLGQYKLGDFGIARSAEYDMRTRAGTSCYMAPELYLPEAAYGPNVDVYALGILLFNLLNDGRPPFMPAFPEPIGPGDFEEAERRRLTGEGLPDARNADGYLADLVRRAAKADPEARIQTAEELLEAIDGWPGWNQAGDRPGPSDGRAGEAGRVAAGLRKPLSRRRVLIAAGVAAVAVGAAGALAVLGPGETAKGTVEADVKLNGWSTADGIAFLRFEGTGGMARGSSTTIAVRNDGSTSISLREGAYDVSLAASPVYADGTVFYPDADIQHITVTSSRKPATVEVRGEKRESPRCVGAPLLSSDDVRDFEEAAAASGVPDSIVGPYADAINLALRKYLASEMEGRVLYEGENNPVLQAGSYSFALASYWEGKVEVKCTDQGFTVYPAGLVNAPVMEAWTGESSQTVDEGDNLLLWERPFGNGRSVFVIAPNYHSFASAYSEGLIPDDVLSTCLDLMSEGSLTLEEARQSGSSASKVEYFMSPRRAFMVGDAADAAFEELRGTTGWFSTTVAPNVGKLRTAVTFAALSNGRLVLFGSMRNAESKEGLGFDSAALRGPRVWAFEVSDTATYELYGGIDGPKQSARDAFFAYVVDLIGVTMRLEVVDGVVVHAELAS